MKALQIFRTMAAAVALAAITALTGCEKEYVRSPQQPEPATPADAIDWSRVKLNVGVNIAAPETRAAKQGWAAGDRIVAFFGTDDENGTGDDYLVLDYIYDDDIDGYKWAINESMSSAGAGIAPTGRLTALHAGNSTDFSIGLDGDSPMLNGVDGELLFTTDPADGTYTWDEANNEMAASITLSRGVSTLIKVINPDPADDNMRWRLAGDGIFVHAGTGIDPAEFVNDPAAALRGLFVPSEIASRDRVAQAYRIGTSYDPVYTHGDEVWFSVLYQPDGNMDEVEVQMIQADDWGNPTGSIYTRTLPAQDLNRPGSVATINEGPGFAGEGGSPLWMMSHELGSPSDITYHAESGMGYYHLTLLTDNTPHPDDFLMQARLFANESEEAVLPPYNYYVVGRHSSPFVRQAIVEAGTVASQQYATSGTVAVSYTLDYYSGTPIYAIVANLTLDDGSKWYGTYSGPIEFGVPPAETILTEDNFPDANFLAALRTLASENNWDRNGDGAIDADEAVQVTEIGVAENGIDDLTGVEHFTSLTKLDCSSNNLTELNLSANTALAYFDCENNPGNEGLFTVKVWENFDTASLPESFTNTGWTYNGSEIELAYTTMM